MPLNPAKFLVKPGARVRLGRINTDEAAGLDKERSIAEFAELTKRLADLQELMYAQGKHAMLVVLQAMDAAGKDSTIRSVFGPINPQGCHVFSFKTPTEHERDHDFLWRVHANTPPLGHLHIFNRSHYEDVLIVRVRNLVEKARWQKRYDHINAFEQLLTDEGVIVVKFFLHISKDYQQEQFEERLAEPHKQWKFSPGDLEERKLWDDYQSAYEDAISKCSTAHAPWYIVPAEKKWFRNLLISRVLVDRLTSLNMRYPRIEYDPKTIKIT